MIERIQAGVTSLAAPAADGGRRTDVAQRFEAMLLGTLLQGMAPNAGVLGIGGTAGDVYGSLLREQYAQLLARTGGIGIAAAVERVLAAAEGPR